LNGKHVSVFYLKGLKVFNEFNEAEGCHYETLEDRKFIGEKDPLSSRCIPRNPLDERKFIKTWNSKNLLQIRFNDNFGIDPTFVLTQIKLF